MDSIILVCGNWKYDLNRWVFVVDSFKRAKIMQVSEEVRFAEFLRMVIEDFCLDQQICKINLSYVSTELMNGLPHDTPPIAVTNERQLRGYLQLSRKSAMRLCVEVVGKYNLPALGEGGVEAKCSASFNKFVESTFSRQSSTSGGGFRHAFKKEERDVEYDEDDDEMGTRFDYCEDEDGASSGDDEFVRLFRKCKIEDTGTDNSESAFDKSYFDMEKMGHHIAEGHCFPSKLELEYRLKVFSVIHRFDFDIVNSTTKLYVAKCWVNKCNWYFRAVRVDDANPCFIVRQFLTEHTCTVTLRSARSRQATPDILGRLYLEYVGSVGRSVKPIHVCEALKKRFGLEIPYWKGHRTLKAAREILTGTAEDSYRDLPAYLYSIRESNPGTRVKLEVDGSNRFKFCFFAFDACIRGFPYMRKVVVVDGTHLQSKYKGTLLTATMQDGNFNIFPVAFGVVDGETDVSWEWFFRQLNVVIPDDPGLAIISDRHPAISNAIRKVYPRAARGVCTYHMRKNIIAKFRGHGFKLFKQAATAYTLEQHNAILSEIQTLDPRLHLYLKKADPKLWSRVHFPGNRYNFTTSNIAESMNNAIIEARSFPIVHLIDAIRAMLTRWFARRKAIAAATTTMLTTTIEKMLKDRIAEATKYSVQELDHQRAVVSRSGSEYVVNLNAKTCTCKRYDLDKIPCVHAIAAAAPLRRTVVELTNPYYYTSLWYHAYGTCVMPRDKTLSIPEEVAAKVCRPPLVRTQPGRPKKSRNKGWDEGLKEKKAKRARKKTTCSRCGSAGHNVRSCKSGEKETQSYLSLL